MEDTWWSIVERDWDVTTESMLFTYSEDEKMNHDLNRLNAWLVLRPEFVPMYPWLLWELSIFECCLYWFIRFFLSNNEKCYITNKQFAELFKVNDDTVSNAIKKLESLWYVQLTKKVKWWWGLIRFIKLNKYDTNITKHKVWTPKSGKPILENTWNRFRKIWKPDGIYNKIIDNNIINNKYIENSNEFSNLKDLDVDPSTPTCTYQAWNVSCDSNSHLNQSICVQEKEKSCAKKEKEVAAARGELAQQTENSLINSIATFYNDNWLLYEDKYEHKYAKLILQNKQIINICTKLWIDITTFCKMIIKASFSSYKWVVSWLKSLYERYAEIYNNTLKTEVDKTQKVQTSTFKSSF